MKRAYKMIYTNTDKQKVSYKHPLNNIMKLLNTHCEMKKYRNAMRCLQTALVLFFAVLQNGLAQPPTKDYWYSINKGFAKCTQIGESSGEATWYKDNFKIDNLIDKQGSMYAWISYGGQTLDSNLVPMPDYNPTSCKSGLFKHDMIEDKWIRMSNELPSGKYLQLLSNGTDILALADNGIIYQHDETQLPFGWKQLTTNLTVKFFHKLTGSSQNILFSNMGGIEFIGDTVFFVVRNHTTTAFTANQIAEQGIMKMNYKTGTFAFDSIGEFPGQALMLDGEWDGDHFDSYKIVDKVAGRFTLFADYMYPMSSDSCYNLGFRHGEHNTVRILWTWDPKNKKWYNISEGPDWRNMLGSACWKSSGFFTSWDKKRIFVSVDQGVYEWRGSAWEFKIKGGLSTVGPIIPVYDPASPIDNLKFYHSVRSGVYLIDKANQMSLGQSSFYSCLNSKRRSLATPDNGKTIYITEDEGPKYPNRCSWEGKFLAFTGVYWLQPDPGKEASTINLHLEAATYIGGTTGPNIPVNVGIGDKYVTFIAGNYPGAIQGVQKTGAWNTAINGVTTSALGKVIALNLFGDTILGITTLANKIYDYEIQNWEPYRMVVAHDLGVTVLEPDGKTVRFNKTHADLSADGLNYSGNPVIADIDDNGHIVVMRGSCPSGGCAAVDGDGDVFGTTAEFIVYDENGSKVTGKTFLNSTESYMDGATTVVNDGKGIKDITMNNDTVFVTYQNEPSYRLNAASQGACKDAGTYFDQPVQQPIVRAYKPNGSSNPMVSIWKLWGFNENELYYESADAMPRKINIGKDGYLYFLGENAGCNSVFRWNGKTTANIEYNAGRGCKAPSVNAYFDAGNNPMNMGPASHQGYVAKIDPHTGDIVKGMFMIPRQSDGTSNTYKLDAAYVHAAANGSVYIGANCASYYLGRDLTHINGKLIGPYAGDAVLMIINPSWSARPFWGTFTRLTDPGSGWVTGFGIRDNVVVGVVKNSSGSMYTGSTRYNPTTNNREFKESYALNVNPLSASTTDDESYLFSFYYDVWNHSQQDTLDPREYPSQPVVPKECFKADANFIADKEQVCVNQNVVFTNMSTNDSIDHTWSFGEDASLLAGTIGEGPHTVSYSSSGLKTVRMQMMSTCGDIVPRERYNYINVLPDTLKLSAIYGSASLCSGGKGYYSVDKIFGVSTYEWSLPAGATIVNGIGTEKIEVFFGATSGAVTCKAKYACGYTPMVSKDVTIIPNVDNTALLVVGENSPLSIADSVLKAKLQSLSYNVMTIDDHDVTADIHQCASTVVVSGTVSADVLGPVFYSINKSVVLLNSGMFSKMGITNGTLEKDYGRAADLTQVNIDDNTHDLGKGLVTGSNSVYDNASWVNDNVIMAINCYGGATTDSKGITYIADKYYGAGGSYGVSSTYAGPDIPVYSKFRNGSPLTYSIPLPNGSYDVVLKAIWPAGRDTTWGANRWMEVNMEGKYLGTTDVYGVVGYDQPMDYRYYEINVTDGYLDILLNRCAGISAIVVLKKTARAEINWGKPISKSISVASLVGYPNKKISFGVDKGVALMGSPSGDTIYTAARRVGLFLDNTGSSYWTNEGQKLFENAMCWANYSCSTEDTIWTNPIPASLCPGEQINVVFNAKGTYNDGNNYFVQLSDAFGSFNAASDIASLTSTSTGVININAVIPDKLLQGGSYRIRVISNNPTSIVYPTNTFTINGSAPKPGPISGPTQICKFIGTATFSIDSVTGASEYLWTIPLGSYFISPVSSQQTIKTTSTSITVGFGLATTNPIIVQSVNSCDTSDKYDGSQELIVQLTEYKAHTPLGISGADTVCQNFQGAYTMAPWVDNGGNTDAVKYQWYVLPAGKVVIVGVDSLNNISLKFNAANDNTVYTLYGYAVGSCGNSDTLSYPILVSNTLSKPKVGAITIQATGCPGQYIYKVTPWQGATAYNWNVTGDAIKTPTGNQNEIIVSYSTVGSKTINLTIVDACGASDIGSRTDNVAVSERSAMLYVKNSTSLTVHENSILSRLQSTLGYTVTIMDKDDPWPASITCIEVVVISGEIDYGIGVRSEIVNGTIPVVAMQWNNSSNSSLTSLNFVLSNNIRTISTTNKLFINDVPHDITAGLYAGFNTVYNSNKNLIFSSPHVNLKRLALLNVGDSAMIEYAEKGTALFNSHTAMSRRVALPYDKSILFGTDLTSTGLALFDQSLCWAAKNCNFPEVQANLISPISYCSANSINVSYHVTGTFNAGNQFILQISDTLGSFVNPTNLDSIASITSGTITSSIPNLPLSNNYRMRVISTNPKRALWYPSQSVVNIIACAACPDSIITASTVTPVLCNGDSTGGVSVTAGNGVEPYTYSWSNGKTNNNITDLKAGLYTVTVSDGNSCTTVRTYTVTEPLAVVATMTSTLSMVNCINPSATIVASGGSTYKWSTGETSPSITVSPVIESNYTVTVADAYGCTATNDTIIKVDIVVPSNAITVNRDTVNCVNDSATITALGGESWIWSNGATTKNITVRPNLESTYTVTITGSNGCNANNDTIIYVDFTLPDNNIFVTNDTVNCVNDTAILIATGGVSWKWNNNETISTIKVAPTSNTTYSVIVTGVNGCVDSASVTVIADISLPTAIVVSDGNVNCTDSIAQLTASGGVTYSWSHGSTDSIINVQPTTNTTYYVTVTNANGCKDSASVTVTTDLTKPVASITVNRDTIDCLNSSATITASGGDGYLWSNSSIEASITVTPSVTTIYTVTVTNNNGCQGVNDTTIIVSGDVPNATITATFDDVNCIRDSSILTVPSASKYKWSTGDSTQSITVKPLLQTTYKVTVTSLNGCSASSSKTIFISFNKPTISSITADSVSCFGKTDGKVTVVASGMGLTYKWDKNPAITDVIANLAPEIYTVTVTGQNGCTATAKDTVSEPQTLFVTIGDSAVKCFGNSDGKLWATPFGGTTPYSYKWQGSVVIKDTLANIGTGSYGVTVTDKRGCTFASSGTVASAPAITASFATQTSPKCYDGNDGVLIVNALGGTGLLSYNWSATNGGEGLVDLSSFQSSLKAGDYEVIVKDANLCERTLTATLTQPEQIVITATPTHVVCKDFAEGKITLTVTNAVGTPTFTWSGGGVKPTSKDQDSLLAGFYSVTVTDGNGCKAESNNIEITQPLNNTELTLSPTNFSCYGSEEASITAKITNANGSETYTWTDTVGNIVGGNSNTLDVARGGWYYLDVSLGSCSVKGSVEITEPDEIIIKTIEAQHPFCNETQDGAIRIQYFGGNGNLTAFWSNGKKGEIINQLPAGEYTVTVSDENCSDTLKIDLPAIKENCIDIPTAFSPNGDGINDVWSIYGLYEYYPNATLEVFDRNGRTVFSAKSKTQFWNGTYNGYPLSIGSYHFVVDYGNGKDVEKGQVTIIR